MQKSREKAIFQYVLQLQESSRNIEIICQYSCAAYLWKQFLTSSYIILFHCKCHLLALACADSESRLKILEDFQDKFIQL